MVAGEASGDLLAGLLLGGLRARWPQLSADGIGGPQMAEHGLRGLVAARQAGGARLRRGAAPLPRDRRHPQPAGRAAAARQARRLHRRRRARLQPRPRGASCKRAGVKTIHFVSPSIWAWRGKRIEKISRAADLVLCIFPFEPEIYAKHGINAVYVGHPLAERDPARAAARRGARRARHRRRRDAGRAAAGQPRARRSSTSRRACFGAAARDAARAARRCASSLPVVAGLRDADRAAAHAARARRADRRCSTAARTRRSPPATSPSSPAARRRSRRRCSSGRWSSPTRCTR